MKILLKYWLPVLVWLGVIFVGSTDVMSAEQTSRFLVPFLRWLKPDISPETLALIHFGVRKLAHLTEYAILACCSGTLCVTLSLLHRNAPQRKIHARGPSMIESN